MDTKELEHLLDVRFEAQQKYFRGEIERHIGIISDDLKDLMKNIKNIHTELSKKVERSEYNVFLEKGAHTS